MFLQIREWLEDLSSSGISGIKISVKKHPLEPVHQSKWYTEFARAHFNIFEIEEKPDLLNALTGKHLLIGFHSTSLLEALSVGVPVITICTTQLPLGINSMLNINLSEVIKPVRDEHEIKKLIKQFKSDTNFATQWSAESYKVGSAFFAKDYYKNVAQVFNN